MILQCVTSKTQKTQTKFSFILTHGKLGLTRCQWSILKAILMAKIGPKLWLEYIFHRRKNFHLIVRILLSNMTNEFCYFVFIQEEQFCTVQKVFGCKTITHAHRINFKNLINRVRIGFLDHIGAGRRYLIE